MKCSLSSVRALSGLLSRLDRRAGTQGLTLIELLLAVVVAGVVAGAAGSVLLAQIKSSAVIELAQRQRDDSSRLDYLIQIEAGEAASVIDSPTLPLACAEAGTTAVVAFRIPRDRGQYLDLTNASNVYYFNNGGAVWRCGPPVKRSGVLDHDPAKLLEAGVAVRDATLEKTNCFGQVTSSGQFVYRLVFPEGYQPGCSVASAKTLLVCNAGDVCD